MDQLKVVFSVKSARCSAISILIFGIFFDAVASTIVGVRTVRYFSSEKHDIYFFPSSSSWTYWLQLCYPLVIALWSHLTGAVGVCATSPRRSRETCLIGTFCAFSLVLCGSEAYAIKDYVPYLRSSIEMLKTNLCDETAIWENCYFNVSLFGAFILLAALLLLGSFWSFICCLGTLFFMPRRQRLEQDQELAPRINADQDNTMQGYAPMCNPAMQGSMQNVEGNAPVVPNPGTPNDPTMQGNIQGNAPMMPNPGIPNDPTMQSNMQVNAPLMPNPGIPNDPTMQDNMQNMQYP